MPKEKKKKENGLMVKELSGWMMKLKKIDLIFNKYSPIYYKKQKKKSNQIKNRSEKNQSEIIKLYKNFLILKCANSC